MKIKVKIIGIIWPMLLSAGIAFAGDVAIPNTFVAGTKAVAAEVNANFGAVATEINDNDSRITSLESDMTAVQTDLTDKVDAGGDTMTGDLTVPRIVYSVARTHYISISGDAFTPRIGSDNYSRAFGNGGCRITDSGSTGALIAALSMPDNATITQVTTYVYDNNAANNLKTFVYFQALSGGYLVIADSSSLISSGASTTTQQLSQSVDYDVYNQNGAVVVFAIPDTGSSWPATNDLLIRGVRITYTINEAP